MAISDIVLAIAKAGLAVKSQLDLIKSNNEDAEQLASQIEAITVAVFDLTKPTKPLDSSDEASYMKALTILSGTLMNCEKFLNEFIHLKDKSTAVAKLRKFFNATKNNKALADYKTQLWGGQTMLNISISGKK